MGHTARLPVELVVELTPAQIARAFCDLGDEDQAQVFIEAAEIARSWDGPGAVMDQWYAVGRHLRTCDCATYEARDLIRRLAMGVGEVGD